MSYTNVIKALQDSNTPLYGPIYDYTIAETPLTNEFDKLWNFGNDVFSSDIGKHIENPTLIFNTIKASNAGAYISNGYSIVEIFMGAVSDNKNYFQERADKFQNENLVKYQVMANNFGISADYFLFQYVMAFFVFHEIGHLIQKNGNNPDLLIEFMAKVCGGDQIQVSHVNEFDADWFACNQLANLAFRLHGEVFDNLNNENKLAELYKFSELALAGIYVFMTRTTESTPKLYFRDKCHPHPSVRIVYIIFYFLDTLKKIAGLEFDVPQVLRNAIPIAESIMKEGEDNPIRKYGEIMTDNLGEIDVYIKEIIENCKATPSTCWNKLD